MDNKSSVLIGIIVLVVVAAVLYPLIGDRVVDMTDPNSTSYVGADSEGIVSMIPVFFWLFVGLTVIGGALVAVRDSV